jgi:hypothetical protein
MAEKRNMYRLLVGKPEGMRPLAVQLVAFQVVLSCI